MPSCGFRQGRRHVCGGAGFPSVGRTLTCGGARLLGSGMGSAGAVFSFRWVVTAIHKVLRLSRQTVVRHRAAVRAEK